MHDRLPPWGQEHPPHQLPSSGRACRRRGFTFDYGAVGRTPPGWWVVGGDGSDSSFRRWAATRIKPAAISSAPIASLQAIFRRTGGPGCRRVRDAKVIAGYGIIRQVAGTVTRLGELTRTNS